MKYANRLLITLLIAMMCVECYAQKKLFKQALEKGRKPNEFYTIYNSDSKAGKLADFREYAANQNYIVGEVTSIGKTVCTFEFLPKSEYESYLYANLRTDNSVDFSRLTKGGEAYCFRNQSGNNATFTYTNAKWSGETSRAHIQGTGVGYAHPTDKLSRIYFKGKFKDGVPEGEITYVWYQLKGEYEFGKYDASRVTKYQCVVGSFSNDLAPIKTNGKYGFINKTGRIVIAPQYSSVVAGFLNGKATVVYNNEEIIIDKTGKKIDLSARQKSKNAEAKRQKEVANNTQKKTNSDNQKKTTDNKQKKSTDNKQNTPTLYPYTVVFEDGVYYAETESILWCDQRFNDVSFKSLGGLMFGHDSNYTASIFSVSFTIADSKRTSSWSPLIKSIKFGEERDAKFIIHLKGTSETITTPGLIQNMLSNNEEGRNFHNKGGGMFCLNWGAPLSSTSKQKAKKTKSHDTYIVRMFCKYDISYFEVEIGNGKKATLQMEPLKTAATFKAMVNDVEKKMGKVGYYRE